MTRFEKRQRERIKKVLAKKGFTDKEIDAAIEEAQEERPFLDFFIKYVWPLLLQLLESLILAKRAAGN